MGYKTSTIKWTAYNTKFYGSLNFIRTILPVETREAVYIVPTGLHRESWARNGSWYEIPVCLDTKGNWSVMSYGHDY